MAKDAHVSDTTSNDKTALLYANVCMGRYVLPVHTCPSLFQLGHQLTVKR